MPRDTTVIAFRQPEAIDDPLSEVAREGEDVDYRNPRGLDRALFQKLAEGEWINTHDNLALIGPTESGSYCPPRYAVRMPSHFDVDRQTTAAEYGVDPQRA